MPDLRGVFAAAVTPLLDGGTRLDEAGIGDVADFLVKGGVDGALVCGTAGEGMVLGLDERQRALAAYLAAAGSRLAIMAHCGAQTTADTVALAAHAAEAGAVGVSVIAPPYFPLDERALLEHLAAAALGLRAAARSTSTRSPRAAATRCRSSVIERLGERVPNLAGPQGLGGAVGALRAVSGRRPRRLRRARVADRPRAGRGRRGSDLGAGERAARAGLRCGA